jgi:hypothetical protein
VTFGYGVDDDHTWCRTLETIDPRIETINMALPGYGVDQAYLWYKRDAGRFEHHVHVFAPITDDFRRIQSERFQGRARPLLAVEDGRLVVTNVPVPSGPFEQRWWTEFRRDLWSLRSAEALRRLRRGLSGDQDDQDAGPGEVALQKAADKLAADRKTETVVRQLMLDLKTLNEARGSILVAAFLPTYYDRGRDTEFWGGVMESACRQLGIPFVDVVREFDRLPPDEAIRLHLPDLGHFNEAGNEWVAQLIYRKLAEFPEVSRALAPGQRS